MNKPSAPVSPLRLVTVVNSPDVTAADLPTEFLFEINEAQAVRVVTLAKRVHQLGVQRVVTHLDDESSVRVGDDLDGEDAVVMEATDFALTVTATRFYVECRLADLSDFPITSEPVDVLKICSHFGIDWEDFCDPTAPRVVIFAEGGVVHEIEADQPVHVHLVDYDTDGADEDGVIEMDDGSDAYCSHWGVVGSKVNAEGVANTMAYIEDALAAKESA